PPVFGSHCEGASAASTLRVLRHRASTTCHQRSLMPLQNRATPFGALIATSERGNASRVESGPASTNSLGWFVGRASGEQLIDFGIARRKWDPAGRRSGIEQGLNSLGRAAIFPVRVDARANRQRQRGAPSPIACVHRRLALDQQSYGLVPGTPGRDVK